MERYASPIAPNAPPSPPGMTGAAALLTIHLANGEQRVVPLGPDPITVGRADGNTVVIKDEWVSRQHLEVAPGPDGQYYVRDLGSRNGVFINGQRVQNAPLTPNDTVQLGQNTLTFSTGVANARPLAQRSPLPARPRSPQRERASRTATGAGTGTASGAAGATMTTRVAFPASSCSMGVPMRLSVAPRTVISCSTTSRFPVVTPACAGMGGNT